MSEMAGELHFVGVPCAACGELHPREALDDQGWCAACGPSMKRRMRIGSHVIAALVVLPFAIWVWRLDRGGFLPLYAWLIPLIAAYYLGLRVGRTVLDGWVRWRRRP
ncbi:MAG: hypothetical protein ACRELC_01055 [Gemmatimonadota bacterium]